MPHFPDKQIGIRRQRGFSLIESLVSALILGIALFGLAGFHAAALKDGSLVKARSAAVSLAQEKLDDLRSFIRLEDDPSTTAVNECAAPTFCYSEIVSSVTSNVNLGGGSENGASLLLPSGTVAGYIDNYSRAWTVTGATETAGSPLSFSSTCTSISPCTGATAKLATVTISWTDSKGESQLVSLQSVIYAMDPLRLALGTATSFSTQKPKVSYTPIGVPDGVPVPINTGTGEKKESSKPVPEVGTKGIGAEVSFDAISYVSGGGVGFNITQQEEFVTAPCECEFSTGTTGYAPSRMIWDGTSLQAKVGAQVSKTVGVPSGTQNDSCTACCSDHHDVAGQANYDPDRPSSEYVVGNHKHYWYSGCVTGTNGDTSCNTAKKNPTLGYSQVVTGAYLESCRLKRVDGFWRVWQDWRQVKMTVIPYAYLQTGSNLNAYVGMLKAVVENRIRIDSGRVSTDIPLLSGRDIAFSAVGQTNQLLGRAVYVDRIYQADNPTTLDAAYYTKLVALIDNKSDWLNIVPFYEVNLTLLTDWSSNLLAKASVTSQSIVDISDVSAGSYSNYSRGKVTALASGSETPTITATTRLHNTGVTGGINKSSPSYGISGYDNTGPLSDSITVILPGSTSDLGISGKFIRANISAGFTTLGVSGSGATCSLATFTSGNQRSFNCAVASGSSVTLTYSSSASGYNFSPASQTFTSVTTAQVAGDVTVYGPTVQISGLITSSGGGKLGSVTATAGTCTISGNKSYSCTMPRGTAGYSGTLTFTGNNPSPSSKAFDGQQADAVVNVSVSK